MVLLVITEAYTHWEEGGHQKDRDGREGFGHMGGVKELPGRIGIAIPKPVPILCFCHKLPMFSSQNGQTLIFT